MNYGTESRLKPCPQTPNCVSSLDSNDRYAIEPLVYICTLEKAYETLLGVIGAEPRVKITNREPNYIRAEFKSRGFEFTDDVEFFFPAGQSVIHVRSASRAGYHDFGVNRKRIERLRGLLEAALRNNENEE
jgi:uncharacterized protein (DUF1499 family)